jgi:hypothetical protein
VAWNNTYTGPATLFDYDDSPYIEERRDYIDYNSCSGDHLSETICLEFWDDVTQQKKNYHAYVYPHPLATSAPPRPPGPPTGLRIVR